MGSGNFFKAIISLKKHKGSSSPEKAKQKLRNSHHRASGKATSDSAGAANIPTEDAAATRIQTAYRAYKARKNLRRLKGTIRAQALTHRPSIKKQATTALQYLHRWQEIQMQLKARRMYMVSQGRLEQKKLESQQKLEARLHDVEVEWDSGSESKDEILARIHSREEASAKRERAMAYAFSHQWRANASNQWLGNYEPGRTNWGWSWKDRWIAARPWEVRSFTAFSGQKKRQNPTAVTKTVKNVNPHSPETSVSVQTSHPNGKRDAAARRLSFPGAGKPRPRERNASADHRDYRARIPVS